MTVSNTKEMVSTNQHQVLTTDTKRESKKMAGNKKDNITTH